jgi:hypothetical protein
MALEVSSPEEKTVGEQQGETQPMRNESWTSWRPEEEALCQHDIEVPFARKITDTSPRRRTGDRPVGCLGRAVLRREKCDMMVESRNSLTRRVGHCYATAPKHVSSATNQTENLVCVVVIYIVHELVRLTIIHSYEL